MGIHTHNASVIAIGVGRFINDDHLMETITARTPRGFCVLATFIINIYYSMVTQCSHTRVRKIGTRKAGSSSDGLIHSLSKVRR